MGQKGRNPDKITFGLLLFIRVDASRPKVAGELADAIPLVVGDVEEDFGAGNFGETHGSEPSAIKFDFFLEFGF